MNNSITSFEISHYSPPGIRYAFCDTLEKLLEKRSNLQKLAVESLNFYQLSFLNHPFLEELKLCVTTLQFPDDIDALRSLHRLRLGKEVTLNDANFKRLCRLIKHSKTLCDVSYENLSDNRGGEFFSAALKSKSLARIEIQLNNISEETGDIIAKFICETTSVYFLSIDNNEDIASHAREAILSALCVNQTLHSFSISGYSDSPVNTSYLRDILRENRSLTWLGVHSCPFVSDSDLDLRELKQLIDSNNNRLVSFPENIDHLQNLIEDKSRRNLNLLNRADMEARWILFYGRIFAGSHFKSGSRFLPVELLEAILMSLSAGGFLIPERRKLIVRTTLNRRTIGKLKNHYLRFSIASLEYLCKKI